MSKFLRRLLVVRMLVGLTMTAVLAGGSSIAAELRSSAGQRAIRRNVKYTFVKPAGAQETETQDTAEPAMEPAAPASKAPAVQVPGSSSPGAQRVPQRVPQPRSTPAPSVFENGWGPETEYYEHAPYGNEVDTADSMFPGYCGPRLGGSDGCGVRMWADLDVLMWWRRGHSLPPLVTTSPDNTAFAAAGVLPNATILYGGEGEGGTARPGGRVQAGLWFDACERMGIGGRFFALGEENYGFTQSSPTGSPILAIPFFDAVLNRENALVVAYPTAPNQRTGSIAINGSSELLGADAFFRCAMYDDGCRRIDFIAGYQQSRIDEQLQILATANVAGAFNQSIVDAFATTNEYNAGTIGWMSECERGCWKLTSTVKVGFGNMSQTAVLAGRNDITTFGNPVPVVTNEGLFVQSTNRGAYTQQTFAVSPEININYVCHVTNRLDVNVGYTFLYWSDVAQPGLLIDRRIDETGAANVPAFQFRTDDFWVSGVNLGAQFHF